MMNELSPIVSQFSLEGRVAEISRFGNGLINDSYFVRTAGDGKPDYILQRINHAIFRDVDMLQANIEAVTSHIRRKLIERGEADVERKVLRFIQTVDAKPYYFDSASYWRMMVHIPHSVSYETINPTYAHYAGLAFGDFQQLLSDLPVQLGEVIPKFHNMEFRLQQLDEAVQANAVDRLAAVRGLVDEIGARAEEMCKAERLYREGKLPKRVCHCDTKVNNILFDENGTILCVVDLDTVMPSFIFSDYGDFMRTAANTGAEDDRDLSKVGLDIPIFKEFTKGYLRSAGSFLTPVEVENLPYAAKLFPYMQLVRFLADYINGDVYYKTKYAEHNLVRSQAQFKLLQSMEKHTPTMEAYIRNCMDSIKS